MQRDNVNTERKLSSAHQSSMYSALVTLYCRFLRASHCLRLGFLPVSFEYSSSLSISFFLQRGSGVRRRPAICQAAADPSLQRAGHTRTRHRPHVLRTVFCNPGTAFRRSCPSLTPFPQALQARGPAAWPPPPATPPDRDSDERAPEPGIAPRQHSSRLDPGPNSQRRTCDGHSAFSPADSQSNAREALLACTCAHRERGRGELGAAPPERRRLPHGCEKKKHLGQSNFKLEGAQRAHHKLTLGRGGVWGACSQELVRFVEQ